MTKDAVKDYISAIDFEEEEKIKAGVRTINGTSWISQTLNMHGCELKH